jgi:hypothetical protein
LFPWIKNDKGATFKLLGPTAEKGTATKEVKRRDKKTTSLAKNFFIRVSPSNHYCRISELYTEKKVKSTRLTEVVSGFFSLFHGEISQNPYLVSARSKTNSPRVKEGKKNKKRMPFF